MSAPDLISVGVTDRAPGLFENLFPAPEGMMYNSYVIRDEKNAVLDAVGAPFGEAWLGNIARALAGRKPDCLIVQHMEMDHAASITAFLTAFPEAEVVASRRAFGMMDACFGPEAVPRRHVVAEGDRLALGRHTLRFIAAPMVHWPEVMMTFDEQSGTLFSADAFGRFGAEDIRGDWADEARRYYFGIVGKYGAQVQSVLRKLAALPVKTICPLHGPALHAPLTEPLRLYSLWAGYQPETEGVIIAHASVYGQTRQAAELLAKQLRQGGCAFVAVHDLARGDLSAAVADAFRCGTLVLASATYNGDVFPPMKAFLSWLTARNFSARRVALMENGTWAPAAARVMQEALSGCKDITFAEHAVRINATLNADSRAQIATLAKELCE